tara:strand:+ start:17781 stop:18986 length:1206 start_codon:yes stop_codon:yes gene_type:complete
MAFTTLVDYSRQLTQAPDTTAIFSGDTEILGSLTLGSIYSNGLSDYSKLYFSSSTLTTSPEIKYNPLLKNWLFTMRDPADATATEHQLNRLKFTLNTAGKNGEFGFYGQQSFFRYTSDDMDGLQSNVLHNPATVMIIGSGTTSASTAFTVSNWNSSTGIGMTGLTIDDGMNVRIGDRRPYANADSNTCQVFLGPGGILNNQEDYEVLYIGGEGRVGIDLSRRDVKMNIDYDYDSSWIYGLKPVQFEFKKSPGRIQWGFIAEDAAEVKKDFAKWDSDGSLRGVKHERLVSVVLKELIELRKKVDPSFRKTHEEDKVKIISDDYEVIHDGTIIARGGKDIKLTISDSLSGMVRIKSLANVTVRSNRLIDEKWGQMELEDGSSVSLLCHDKFIYILSSDGDKLK